MRVQSVVPWIIIGVLATWLPHSALGQELTSAPRTLRFFYASSTAAKRVEIDVSRSQLLGRVVSLHVKSATIEGLLAAIQGQTGLTFAYDREFPATRPVTLEAESITVAAALGAILIGTGVDVVLTRTGHVWLSKSTPRPSLPQEGIISGKVSDKQTDHPIGGATIVLDPTGRTSSTDADGRYRFDHVAAGPYTLRGRYIGYIAQSASVTVSADEEVRLDLSLEKSAQRLQQIVVTGTLVPTEVRALPSPITVVDATDFDRQRPRTAGQLFRQVVPTGFFTDLPSVPAQSPVSMRGASSLAYGGSNAKVYVDGVETAERVFATVDPRSVQRMEIVRGPQAGAIYGSDAIAGVLQLFTRRGQLDEGGPHFDAEAAVGPIQSAYVGSGALRQEYSLSAHGGSKTASYGMGGGYIHVGDWVPTFFASTVSVYGGFHFEQNGVTLDATGRYYTPDLATVVPDPRAEQTGFAPYSKPQYLSGPVREQTYGTTLGYNLRPWWRHAVTVGVDLYSSDQQNTRRRLTTPADTFLYVQRSSSRKSSIAYNTSLQFPLRHATAGTFTVGFDHYAAALDQFYSTGALDTTGNIPTDPNQPFTPTLASTRNTGYFAQAMVNVQDELYLTAGLRAENNSAFGASIGTPISPKAGLSFVHRVGSALLKLRSSYGEGIRPPGAGLRLASRTQFQIILANNLLGPERQQGFDAGVDLLIGDNASVSVTYYDQKVRDLIQLALVDATSSPATFQRLNVARIRNTGWEFEGRVRANRLEFGAQMGIARSRVKALNANYSGDLRVGDQVLGFPRYTAGGFLTFEPTRGTNLTTGISVVGDRTDYDYLAQFRCFGGTGPCQSSLREYWVTYPAFAKVNLAVSQQVSRGITASISIDNLTNSIADESWNIVPAQGRVTLVGMRVSK
jgi:outer membrane receptor protein involved in Fe transport